jgi:hypothetical protein
MLFVQAQRDGQLGLAMVLFQLPQTRTNAVAHQLVLGLRVLSHMLKHRADLVRESFFALVDMGKFFRSHTSDLLVYTCLQMQPYQTKFLAFLNSVWEEAPEAEPRILAAVLSCAPFLEIPDTVSRQRVRVYN